MVKEESTYSCIFCKNPIPNSEIPAEVWNKISMQIVWHEACHPDNK